MTRWSEPQSFNEAMTAMARIAVEQRESLINEMGDRGRVLLDNVLPEGFTIRQQANGAWVGKWPRGECRADDQRWVESMLFMCAADELELREVLR